MCNSAAMSTAPVSTQLINIWADGVRESANFPAGNTERHDPIA